MLSCAQTITIITHIKTLKPCAETRRGRGAVIERHILYVSFPKINPLHKADLKRDLHDKPFL